MSTGAVWRASRAAVRRRRVQTAVIGLVVLVSTTTVVLTLAMLGAATAPFDEAFEHQRGAHAVVTFDAGSVTGEQLAATATRPGVEAAEGPFAQTVVNVTSDWHGEASGPLTVVGRADPGGEVDRVRLRSGRWASAPGELVVNFAAQGDPAPGLLGRRVEVEGGPPLTVVGFATSMSQSAGAWVTPGQLRASHPTEAQMLYRFTDAGTDERVRAGVAGATRDLPDGSLLATQSYRSLRLAFSAKVDSYLPLLVAFGVLGLAVCVLIVGNVISGAVVSGYRHIGVLKALGFTPNQVTAVYLTMVSVPAVVGCVLGTLAGNALARPVLAVAFTGVQAGSATATGVGPWVSVAALLGMPALVVAAALVPALRARRLPAARAISAGSAPRTGRGLRVQRLLAGTRLPRPVSLGLGQPFARAGRSAMTAAAVVLGVASVTLATGLSSTMIAASEVGRTGATTVRVEVGGAGEVPGPEPALTDAGIQERLGAIAGAERVTGRAFVEVRLDGFTLNRFANLYSGDRPPEFLSHVVDGRWVSAPGEVVAGPAFLAQHGLAVGDPVTLRGARRSVTATVVGTLGDSNARAVSTDEQTAALLAQDATPVEYYVRLAPDADVAAYLDAVREADPGLRPSTVDPGSYAATTVVSISTVFTVLLSVVAALGVLNTVLLGVRERRRDLGMLKSIGMTPRQVVVMTVASVAAPGALGGLLGLPIGMLAHRVLVDNVGVVVFTESMKNVWHAPTLAVLAPAGLVIAVLGALVPARSAARLTVARVLRDE